jgi:hypothetical protein
MDPYLESRRFWSDVHHSLIYALRAALNPVLPSEFMARIEERLYVVEPPRDFRPDVSVVQPRQQRQFAAALLTQAFPRAADAPIIVRAPREEVREGFIEIVSLTEGERVVATIEVLSPKNKTVGKGRAEYRRKQRDALQSEVHLLEIDLLRSGPHTLAAPERELRAEAGRWDYLVSLHRAGAAGEFETWPRTVRQRLPLVTVPLTESIADAALDLQAAFDRVYDDGFFGRAINYRAEPDPPLASDDAAWADQLLRQAGLRP